MDIRRFDSITQAEAGVAMKLVDPVTKADTGATITLYGADSAIQKQARKEIEAKNKALGRALTPEEIENDTLELLARCTKGWDGLDEGGEPIPFSQAKAKELYKAYPELADQVSRFVFTRVNFFVSASGDSRRPSARKRG